jgi:hypothetical protein
MIILILDRFPYPKFGDLVVPRAAMLSTWAAARVLVLYISCGALITPIDVYARLITRSN